METDLKEYTESFFLTPGECNAQQVMPVSLLVSRIIEVATGHANSWGVGYSALKANNEAWVLSRVTIEMTRYPGVNENYSLTTWIEGYNRRFSERNFAVTDGEGNVIGYARTIWVAINTITRESADISQFAYIVNNISGRPCPIEKQSRLRPVESTRASKYVFKYSDVDLNRHVNSVRYIEHLLNLWDLDFYDNHVIGRFEIAYMKECLYGMEVEIKVDDSTSDCHAEILHEGEPLCRARIVFSDEMQEDKR